MTSHNTQNEINFIDMLGIWARGQHQIKRAELLRRYLSGARRRADWNGMDAYRVMEHAAKLLERMV